MKLYSLIFLFFVIISCDCSYDYRYEIRNETNAVLKVRFKSFQYDTIYRIAANDAKLIAIQSHGAEGCDGPYFDDLYEHVAELTVFKNDTVPSVRDFLNSNSWVFDHGTYRAVLTDADF